MQVGILTFHDGINYGAFFQVYALQSFLVQHGFDCRVINYKSIGFTKREYKVFLGPRLLHPRRLVKGIIIKNIVKIARFKMAHRRLNFTRRIFEEDKLSKLHFDAIVIGSDEVWNFGSRLIGYDPVYFSRGLQASRIISYAASFGRTKADEAIPEELKNALNRIDYVSVRDENSANIMRAITKKPVQITLDPCFLVDLKPEAITPHDAGFILIYGFFNKTMIHQVLEYARFVGKKTVSVGYNRPWCDVSLDTLSPLQWLGYFANCDRVITTMFHGMIFALLNQKDFCMFSTPYRKNKVGNLLSDLGLSDRFVDESQSIKEALARKIDYPKVNARIEAKRRQSEEFLLSALKS
ncbi:MAG: polysaccharide pyruvyl transferase family protein [Anaerolineales bacterium]|nr:polysaccharide pyruvyl transferase family protein [Anaerolineales bacterium]